MIQKRHKLVIQNVVEGSTPDPRADEKITYVNWKTVYASIEPLQGRELQFAQQMHGQVTHKIAMRWIDGVTKRMRGVWNGRIFNFSPANNLEERDFELTLYATESV